MRTFVLNPVLKVRELSQKICKDSTAMLEEAIGLARAIDLEIIGSQNVTLKKIRPDLYFGKGLIEAIKNENDPFDLLLVNTNLSPIQQRNLEMALDLKVLDRTGIILEIFGKRATTKEGMLQVDLASLSYQRSRLVRSWTHLERQRGGGGFMGGPGETQIELDRRQIDQQIIRIKKQLKQVERTRGLHRASRDKVPYPIVALVGYTNAGKSTLFNALTGANVFVEDQVFATLDPTMREVKLPSGRQIILSDTVGFISDLPTHLVAAFRSTLEEVIYADMILHISDFSDINRDAHREDVLKTLTELEVDTHSDERLFEVRNKIDRLEMLDENMLEENFEDAIFYISAVKKTGFDKLLRGIEQFLDRKQCSMNVGFSAQRGDVLAWLHRNASVVSQEHEGEEIRLAIRITEEKIQRARSYYGKAIAWN